MIRGVVFDIDDTLYLEREYVASGFTFVARQIGRTRTEAAAIGRWLDAAFAHGVRGDTFDRLRDAFPSVGRRHSTRELVDLYRRHSPAIALLPGAEAVLEHLVGRGLRVGVLSDGPVSSQEEKVRALDLHRWCDPVLLTARLGAEQAKPSIAGFVLIEEAWGLARAAMCYVGDNPAKDFRGPRGRGWRTVRLRHPGQLRASSEPVAPDDRPDVEIASLEALPDCPGF